MINNLAQAVQDYMKRPIENQDAQELMYGVRMFSALQRVIRSCLHPLQYPTSEEIADANLQSEHDRRTQSHRLEQLKIWNHIAQHKCRCEECLHLMEVRSDHMATLPLWLCECYALKYLNTFEEIDEMLPPKLRDRQNELFKCFSQVPVWNHSTSSQSETRDTSFVNAGDLINVYRAPLFCFWPSCLGYEVLRIGFTFMDETTPSKQLKQLLQSDLANNDVKKQFCQEIYLQVKDFIAEQNHFERFRFIIAIEVPKKMKDVKNSKGHSLWAIVTLMQLRDSMLNASRDLQWLQPTAFSSFGDTNVPVPEKPRTSQKIRFTMKNRDGKSDLAEETEFKLDDFRRLEWKKILGLGKSNGRDDDDKNLRLRFCTRIMMQGYPAANAVAPFSKSGDITVANTGSDKHTMYIPEEQKAYFTCFDSDTSIPIEARCDMELVLSKPIMMTEGARWAVAFTPSQKEWDLIKFDHLLEHDNVVVRDNLRAVMQCLRSSWHEGAKDRSMSRSRSNRRRASAPNAIGSEMSTESAMPSFNLNELQFDCVRDLRDQSLMFISDMTEAVACNIHKEDISRYFALQGTIGQFVSKIKVVTDVNPERQSSQQVAANHSQQAPPETKSSATANNLVPEIELAILQR